MFSDTRPAEQAMADLILAMLTEQHDKGVHVADLINGAGVALCTLLDSYAEVNGAGRFLRTLADRYDADPLRGAGANRTRN